MMSLNNGIITTSELIIKLREILNPQGFFKCCHGLFILSAIYFIFSLIFSLLLS